MWRRTLEVLIDNIGEFVSGEDISDQLGVTRAAIWKHVDQIKKEGYPVESVSRRGYRLVEIPDKIDEVTIRWGLDTRVLGSHIVSLNSTESTNMLAKEMAVEGSKEGTVIIADEQTGGKGRMGREWISPPQKGIWMSIILRPSIAPAKAPLITSMAAIAAIRGIEKVTRLKPSIKWPNDILIGDKKVCGILTEMQGDMDIIQFVVVGIGINANLDLEDFPKELKDRATSLKLECGELVMRADIVREILREFEDLYNKYTETGDSQSIISAISKNSATIGKKVRVTGVNMDLEGVAVAIADDGALMVMLDDGQIQKIMSGDVSVRGMHGYV